MQGTVVQLDALLADNHQIGSVANSTSPPPGPGRPMRGTVRGFDTRTGMGKITGDDDTTYSFFGAGVLDGKDLTPGQCVEFNDNDGIATKITVTSKVPMPAAASSIGSIANSTSPPPGVGRTMRGAVQGFDSRTGRGKIKGEDGSTYSFYSAGVLDGKSTAVGQKVEFNDNDGIATKILITGDAPASGYIGAVANSSSPQPGPGRTMRGRVDGFDSRTGMGKIKGNDDVTHSFFSAGVVGGKILTRGSIVEFNDNDGVATKIVVIGGTPEAVGTIGAISNSSSPPPSNGRPMHGKVEGFDSRTGMGKIRGDDDTTYRFFPAGVANGKRLKPGKKVTFTDRDGVATDVQLVRSRLMRALFGA